MNNINKPIYLPHEWWKISNSSSSEIIKEEDTNIFNALIEAAKQIETKTELSPVQGLPSATRPINVEQLHELKQQ